MAGGGVDAGPRTLRGILSDAAVERIERQAGDLAALLDLPLEILGIDTPDELSQVLRADDLPLERLIDPSTREPGSTEAVRGIVTGAVGGGIGGGIAIALGAASLVLVGSAVLMRTRP